MTSGPILVTGATGFLGRHVLARASERGLDARATDLRDPRSAAQELREAVAVVHLAAPSRTLPPWELLRAELELAEHVLANIAQGVTVLIAGSAAQYGMGLPRPLKETDPTEAVSGYGAVKNVVEHACTSQLAGAARVIWTRTFNLIGPGQGPETPVASWVAQAGAGGPVRVGNVDVVRDFLDVRDAADAYLDLLATRATGIVNVGSGSGVLLRDLVELLRVPYEVDETLLRPVDPPHVVADVTRLRELTGFAPRRSLQDTVAELLAVGAGR